MVLRCLLWNLLLPLRIESSISWCLALSVLNLRFLLCLLVLWLLDDLELLELLDPLLVLSDFPVTDVPLVEMLESSDL